MEPKHDDKVPAGGGSDKGLCEGRVPLVVASGKMAATPSDSTLLESRALCMRSKALMAAAEFCDRFLLLLVLGIIGVGSGAMAPAGSHSLRLYSWRRRLEERTCVDM